MDLTGQVADWLAKLDSRLTSMDVTGAVALFQPDGIWRDLVALTWTLHPAEGADQIAAMLGACAEQPRDFRLDGPARAAEGWVEAEFTFRTRAIVGRGHVRLIGGKAWTLVTSAEALIDYPWAEGRARALGTSHGAQRGRQNWIREVRDDADVLIIGGGQGGMALAARLQSLGMHAVILEQKPRAGDSWRDRYDGLCLHDPVWYDHMPYIPFPEGWPVFTPKERMADWLEMFAKVMALDYRAGCTVVTAERDAECWKVTARTDGQDRILTAPELVFATGMSGYPRVPNVPGIETFAGRHLHTSDYRTGKNHLGARAVVIGSNTSAHDVCLDLWEHDVPVTMVQRSSTLIARSQNVVETLLGGLYSEDALAEGITTERADFLATTWPWAVMADRMKPVAAKMQAADADLHARLAAKGFLLDNGEDGSGIPLKSARQGGGFYIDVGASDLIADGLIGLEAGRGVGRIEPYAVVLEDETRLPCDLIIFATGYNSMHRFVADICGDETADRVGPVWGLGSGTEKDPGPWEGELRNMWKPTAVDGLWFHGGNLAQSRHYSRFLALQLKARQMGLPTPVVSRAFAS